MFPNSLILLAILGCNHRSADTGVKSEPETTTPPATATEVVTDCAGPSPGVIVTSSCQNVESEQACDLQLLDQDCAAFSLSSQLGKVVLLDFSAMWCGPCQSAATEAQMTQDKYGTTDFTYVSVLINDLNGDDPDEADINDWADFFGITAPVLIGRMDLYDLSGQVGWDFGSIPSFWFIDREGVIQYHLPGWNASTVDSQIDSML